MATGRRTRRRGAAAAAGNTSTAKAAKVTRPRRGPREIVAAATRYMERRFTARTMREPDTTWQRAAWDFYDTTPEVRFSAQWVGNAMGKARLFAGKRAPDGTVEPAPDGHPAAQLVASIAGGVAGQSELLSSFGPHLVVAGEGWIVIRPKRTNQPATRPAANRAVLPALAPAPTPVLEEDPAGVAASEDWWVLSVLEMRRQGAHLEAEIDGEPVNIPPYDPHAPPDPEAPVAIRVWDPHPRRYIEADSPIRSSLGLLEELRLLNAAVAAIARSRLTGRGVLLVPQGTRFPVSPTQGEAEDDLLEVFMTVAETAYKDPDSAAAAVPIVLEVPPESIEKIQRITFESNFDELAVKLREECIRRFALGVEIPAEFLLGMAGINHWGQWASQEEAIRLGVEPRLGTVCDALTTQWLVPNLQDDQQPDADEWLVWYDTSPLRVRANRAQTAIEVFREGAIGLAALRRETGFDDSDAPSPADAERELLIRLVMGSPQLAPLILPLLGIQLPAGAAAQLPAGNSSGGSSPPPAAPDLPADENPGPPAEPDQTPDLTEVTP